MHGCWQRQEHFEIISEYCKTGLLVMFNVTSGGISLPASVVFFSSALSWCVYCPCVVTYVFAHALYLEPWFTFFSKVADLRYRLQMNTRFLLGSLW